MTSVLFVRLSAMGDLVQGIGAIEALHQVRPDWRLSCVTQAELVPLLDGAAGLHRVIPFARRGGLAAVFQLRRRLAAERYDVAVDLQGNWKSAIVARISGARQRLGMGGSWRQEPWSRLLLHRTIDAVGTPHPARAAFELVRALAADAPFLLPRLAATPAEVQRERELVGQLGIDCDHPFDVFVLGDPSDPRSLRPDVVTAALAARAGKVVCLLGPGEAGIAPPDGVPTMRHGPGEVRRLIALGALVAASGGRIVGSDQGPAHVLSAAGAKAWVLFGSQDARRSGPPGAVGLVHPSPPPCSPCRRQRCNHPAGPVCMEFVPEAGRVVEVGVHPRR